MKVDSSMTLVDDAKRVLHTRIEVVGLLVEWRGLEIPHHGEMVEHWKESKKGRVGEDSSR